MDPRDERRTYLIYTVVGALLVVPGAYVQFKYLSGTAVDFVHMLVPALVGVAFGYLAARNTLARKAMSRQIVYDPLTRVYNRRWLTTFAEVQLRACREHGHTLSIAVMDIDYFKRVNDTHGHLVGDAVLVELADSVGKSIRNADWLVRWGGEEFIVVMPETGMAGAAIKAERLRLQIEEQEFPDVQHVTISQGVAQFDPAVDTDLTGLVERADAALYAAKDAGRNCVRLATAGGVQAPAQSPGIVEHVEHPMERSMEQSMLYDATSGPSVKAKPAKQDHGGNEPAVHLFEIDSAEARRIYSTYLSMGAVGVAIVAYLQFTFIDGIDVGPLELVVPVIVGLIAGFLVGRHRLLRNAVDRQMTTDSLTKICNRQWLLRFAEQHLNGCRRYGHKLSILLMDIDHFKKVNDTHGHNVGDEVLVGFSDLVRKELGDRGWLVRWGGEEFLALLQDHDIEKALPVAEHLRKALETHAFETVGRVTCSVGAAQFTPDVDQDFSVLTERADKALYEAKNAGRNRVHAAR